ncbi:hypothetical protein PTSG_03908 [Salpingoeca rosetta]|uniref:Coiled-coil domain-containing protein 12 n=1 Tax=Salpingoeca rosetta (strain ATCC 50818 / BSB-021) TaxID=946362 RepID=F2U782_SALR5|nr:uncharacterized protein PTSG_03908 [Salpingoeca rosetta]EGD83299.1 hypothetical protein PTSG_03908 [Salpingoeca rosetta]|eukprot:XP_004994803.1 hypothetical protein PTSG_03908 [Salpingoeca rosetta]
MSSQASKRSKDESGEPVLKFRNYRPTGDALAASPFLKAKTQASDTQEDEDDAALPFDFPDTSADKGEAEQDGGAMEEAEDEDEHAQPNKHAQHADKTEEEDELVRPPDALERDVQERLKQMDEEDPMKDIQSSTVEDVLSIAPRKVDWDLKRNIAPRLEKLEKRTNRAIAELIHERLRDAKEKQKFEALQSKASA